MTDLRTYEYDLPPELVAQSPIEPRDAARLLDGTSEVPLHRHVRDLPLLLDRNDLVVVNSTRVIPARLRLRKPTGGAVEVLLLERRADGPWSALVRPSKKVAVGLELSAAPTLVVRFGVVTEGGRRLVELCDPATGARLDPAEEQAVLEAIGEAPLPPYITTRLNDPTRYQTVYAVEPGSVAAPTAGLHLTTQLIESIRARGVRWHTVDLVVGLDTFRPITVDDPSDHVMHSERYEVSAETLDAIAATRASGGRVLAIGTTTVRALESAVRGPLAGRTSIFIRPGHRFETIDLLMTNFHLPRSTLLLMVEAFAGPRWRDLYTAAVAQNYRFLSFGDAMLLKSFAPR